MKKQQRLERCWNLHVVTEQKRSSPVRIQPQLEVAFTTHKRYSHSLFPKGVKIFTKPQVFLGIQIYCERRTQQLSYLFCNYLSEKVYSAGKEHWLFRVFFGPASFPLIILASSAQRPLEGWQTQKILFHIKREFSPFKRASQSVSPGKKDESFTIYVQRSRFCRTRRHQEEMVIWRKDKRETREEIWK